MSYSPTTRDAENTGFECINCHRNAKRHTAGSYRNHCPKCLWSKHVDLLPGDRSCDCHGPMQPVGVDHSGKKGHILIHQCTLCGVRDRNKVAPDDDVDAVIALLAPPR